MMHIFGVRDGRLVRLPLTITDLPTSSGLLWIDLYYPTPGEEQCVEKLLGLQVPTREEMAEIEESARLYEERGALVMTARRVPSPGASRWAHGRCGISTAQVGILL
jgi:magnesium transporter